ncbi:MAG: NAD(P)H-binding protein [bacterium]
MNQPILVAGASGFVGRALVAAAAARGHAVRALARRPHPAPPGVTAITADVNDFEATARALDGAAAAIYLVHGLADPRFRRRDLDAARRFGAAARAAGVERIVYLGALGDADGDRTPHVTSRREVAAALRLRGIPVTELRAAVVVGRGSAVIELFRRLAARSPLLVAPHGSARRVQPIALADAVAALLAPLADDTPGDATHEIGGDTVLTWHAFMQRCLPCLGSHRRLHAMPIATPRLSGLWMRAFGGMPLTMGTEFIRNLGHDAIARDDHTRALIGRAPTPLDRALREALVDHVG